MRRRDFIKGIAGLVAATWPLPTRAQQPKRHIGVLTPFTADDPQTKANLAAFRLELERLGWAEKRNVEIDYRFVANRRDQLALLAQELVDLKPEVILAQATEVAAALQKQTRTIPIVFNNVSDPIGSHFVTSLARPGGNLTGFLLYEDGIVGKWLAMLKEISPRLSRIGLLANPKTTPFDYFLHSAEAAAARLSIELVQLPVAMTEDIDRAVALFTATQDGGVVVLPDPTTTALRDVIVAIANRYRLPAVYPFRFYVDAGGLMSYGTDRVDVFRRSAVYVDRILRGEKPADLPVQAPIKYETVVNLKTAKAMGLQVPSSLMVRADEVIE